MPSPETLLRSALPLGLLLTAAIPAQSKACGRYPLDADLLHPELVDGLPTSASRDVFPPNLGLHGSLPTDAQLEPGKRPGQFELIQGRKKKKVVLPGIFEIELRFSKRESREHRFYLRESSGRFLLRSDSGCNVELLGHEVWFADLDADGAFGGPNDGWIARGPRARRWVEEGADKALFQTMDSPLELPDGQVFFDVDPRGFHVNVLPELPEPDPAAESADRMAQMEAAVELWNAARARIGADPVELDEELSQGCADLAVFKAIHGAAQEVRPGLAGFTKAAMKAYSVAPSVRTRDPVLAIHVWLGGFNNRALLLDPRNRKVGLAVESGSAFVDTVNGRGAKRFDPYVWPPDAAAGVPLHSPSGESPSPLGDAPFDPDSAPRYGYPVTLTFPSPNVADVQVELLEDGKSMPVRFTSPEQPGYPSRPDNANTVWIVSTRPFRPGTEYTARIRCTFADEPYTREWSFTTEGK